MSILGQQLNDCGALLTLYMELTMTNDFAKIGQFGYDSDEINNLRLSHKEIVTLKDYNWRINIKSMAWIAFR